MNSTVGADESRTKVIIQAHDDKTRASLKQLALATRGETTRDLPIIDAFAATVPTESLGTLRAAALQAGSDVRIIPDRVLHIDNPHAEPPPIHTQDNIANQTVKLQPVWDAGFRGQGIGIAIIDTGVAPHDDFGERLVAFQDFVNFNTDPYDDAGHGTHVAGIAAGDGALSSGRYSGAAPEASIIGIKVMDAEGSGELSNIIAGIQWAVENKETYNIRVINMSLGGPPTGPASEDPLMQAAAEANRAGILVVAAAGNKGPFPKTIDSPAAAPEVLAVGATIDYRTPELTDDKVAGYSSSGPTPFDKLTKPDVVAPGTNIATTDPNGRYAYDTGTSMASPLVAGMAAVMFQAGPYLTPEQVKETLMGGAQKIRSYDENTQGKGVVQADRTFQLVQDSIPTKPTP